jgi:hypothetical protein
MINFKALEIPKAIFAYIQPPRPSTLAPLLRGRPAGKFAGVIGSFRRDSGDLMNRRRWRSG